jgi:branched-subunit amino acid permease
MTWREFLNRPKYVFGLIATLVAVWLLFNPEVVVHTINNVVMPILFQLLVVGLMIWGIKIMVFGSKSGKK